jgi:hypothetical protein
MTGRQASENLVAQGEIARAPAERACRDQSFEFPAGIYAAMIAMFTGFIAVLGLSFQSGHMAVAVGVIFFFIAAYFTIPAMFAGAAGEDSSKALSWFDFRDRGIVTETGHSTAFEATTLVLLLPFLVLMFAIAIVTIAALA